MNAGGSRSITAADAVALEPGDERTLVTFEIGSGGKITGKEVSLQREPLPNDEGRDELAEYTATDTGAVDLEWWDPSGGTIEWTIARDGAVIATTTGGWFSDTRPDAATDATYEITGSREVLVDGHSATEPFTTIITVPAIDASPIGRRLDEVSIAADSNRDVLRASSGAYMLQQELNTFIPTAKADTPFNIQPCVEAYGGTGVGYYGGDNRGFSSPSTTEPSARTAIIATTSFDAAGERTGSSAHFRTSGTRLYDSTGKLVAEKNAQLNIEGVGGFGDETGGQATWAHHVADPLCSVAPAIDYELAMGRWGNGSVRLVGWHDQAPSYEWRNSGSNPGWANFYEFDSKGLQYLLPAFPKAHVDIAGNVPS